jgi:hypothetical protein|tara:strand:- start:950 stop:1180 length:231 start_codon:yes stop_codon:yes gene_type:complete
VAVRLYQIAENFYLIGAGTTPCLRWYRDAGRWMSEPTQLPQPAASVALDEVPDDLREELLAFVVRADAMGASQISN